MMLVVSAFLQKDKNNLLTYYSTKSKKIIDFFVSYNVPETPNAKISQNPYIEASDWE